MGRSQAFWHVAGASGLCPRVRQYLDAWIFQACIGLSGARIACSHDQRDSEISIEERDPDCTVHSALSIMGYRWRHSLRFLFIERLVQPDHRVAGS
ncbi:hypothetical protein D3C77_465170 [compost metagenome]